MKKSTKAALLSALVFPGVGHLFLKKYISATTLIVVLCACFYYVVSYVLHQAMQIVGQIQNSTTPPDVGAITNLVAQQSSGLHAHIISIISTIIVISWVAGIIDAYRLGRVQEKIDSSANADKNKLDE